MGLINRDDLRNPEAVVTLLLILHCPSHRNPPDERFWPVNLINRSGSRLSEKTNTKGSRPRGFGLGSQNQECPDWRLNSEM
jgi:hypothetical protein